MIKVDEAHKIYLSCSDTFSSVSPANCDFRNGALSLTYYTWSPFGGKGAYLTFDPPATSVSANISGSIGSNFSPDVTIITGYADNIQIAKFTSVPQTFSYPINYISPQGSSFFNVSIGFSQTSPGGIDDPTSYYWMGLNKITWTSAKQLTLEATYLDADGNETTNIQSSQVQNNDTLSVPLGSAIRFKLKNGGVAVSSSFALSAAVTFKPKIDPDSNPFYGDRLAILFGGSDAMPVHDILTVHTGSQQLVITPTDSSLSPITVNLVVSNPTSIGKAYACGSYANCDDLVLNRAQQSGLPPQFIKGLIYHESNHTFNAESFRYEPRTIDKQFLGKSLGDQDDVYQRYTFHETGNTVTAKQKSIRSQYQIILNGKSIDIPDNYETRGSHYTYLSAKLIVQGNTHQGWNISVADASGNEYEFPAQTVAASSYGLMHVIYISAIDYGDFTEAVNGEILGKDPVGLFDPKTNVQIGVKMLKMNYKKYPNKKKININGLASISDFNMAIMYGFAGYNAGTNYDGSKGKVYKQAVFDASKKFTPTTTNIFSH